MLNFSPLHAADVPHIRKYLEQQPFRVCDNTPGTAFMWRKFLSTSFAVYQDMLLFCIELPGGNKYFTFPIGHGDPGAALDRLESYCKTKNLPLQFSGVPDAGVAFLQMRYGDKCDVKEWRDYFDYLYSADTFLSFPGRHLAGQRNHVRRFWREHPEAVFAPLTQEDVPAAIEFVEKFLRFRAESGVISSVESEEGKRSIELLQNMDALHISGGCLKDGDNILAVSAGEVIGDTLYVHIEKADTRHTGIYQAMSQAFAQYMIRPDVAFINREDDSGDEGLRRSKLSYRPLELIKKSSVVVKGY